MKIVTLIVIHKKSYNPGYLDWLTPIYWNRKNNLRIWVVYQLLKNRDVYNEIKFEAAKQKQDDLRLKKVSADAKKFGFELVPIKTACWPWVIKG